MIMPPHSPPTPRPTIHIDRCVCTQRSFASLLHQARTENLTLPQLIDQTTASEHCGLCKPYLRECLRTGTTVFHHLLPAEE